MAGIKNRLERRYRRRWAISMGGVAVLVAAAIVCLYLVRYEGLSKTPWAYIAVAVALIAALFALAMTLAEAKIEDDLTSKTGRMERARGVRRHKHRD